MNYFCLIFLILGLLVISLSSIDCNSLPFCLSECICYETTTNCSNINLERVPTVAAETSVFDLSFNKIEKLNPNPLRHLSLLIELFLNNNRIEKLSYHLFAGLAKLITLRLDENKIISIDKNCFKNLHNLENLYLNDNRIEFLSNNVFFDLPSLKKVYLQNNRLTQLSKELFANNNNLQEVKLEKNDLVCNCQLLWLKKFSQTITDLKAFCDSPIDLRNRLISEISETDFNCSEPKIDISSSGDQVTQNGFVRSSSQKKLIEFSNGNSLDAKVSSGQNLAQIDSVIQSFGSHLVLNCFHFDNKFKVWTKNDKPLQESLLQSNRLNVATNGSLIIKNLFPIDSAIYKCVDQSNHVIKSYSLKVLEPPVFIEVPDSVIEVESGETLTLKCLAKGFPDPQMGWTRKGRNNFEVNDKSLTLERIKPSDEGIYECIANNSLGIAVKEVKVKVKGGDLEAEPLEDNEVIQSISEAKEIVEQAINLTIKSINDPTYKAGNPGKLLQIARFPLSPDSIEFAKSIEIYEKSLEIIRRKAEAKSKLPFSPFKYLEILSPNQLNILAHLSGCLVGHHSQNTNLNTDCKERCNYKQYRSYEGFCNNEENHLWGASLTPFRRLLPPQYEDGIHLPIGWFADRLYSGFTKPNARRVSQQLIGSKKVSEDERHSHMLMQFGQFLDHDIDFSMPSISFNAFERETLDCSRTCRRIHPCFSIEIPIDDIRRNSTKPRHRSEQNCIELIRSSSSCGSGITSIATGTLMAREQVNQLTAFIDGSNIYGSSANLANHLRDKTRDSGQMRSLIIDGKQYLPLNEARFPNDCQQDPRRSHFGCFLAGDSRANEQLGLLAMHTLWLREHNRIARALAQINPIWSGERVYQESRKIIGAQLQGMSKLGIYSGYHKDVNPSVANVFATAALRFGHTLINPFLLRLNKTYGPITNFSSQLVLHQTFFAPHRLVEEGGIDPLLRGLLFAATKSQRSDQILNTELTEHLFELARDVSLDLAAINIQRGRDHALPDYNRWRKYCNLSFAHTFHDLRHQIKSIKIRDKIKQLYGNPNNIDLWVGAVAEDTIQGSKVGPTFQCLLAEQFRRLRDGDRFYFENSGVFTSEQLNEIRKTSLSRVICDNGDDIPTITSDVFVQPKHQMWKECQHLPSIDLSKWHNSLMPDKGCGDHNVNDFEIPTELLNRLRNG